MPVQTVPLLRAEVSLSTLFCLYIRKPKRNTLIGRIQQVVFKLFFELRKMNQNRFATISRTVKQQKSANRAGSPHGNPDGKKTCSSGQPSVCHSGPTRHKGSSSRYARRRAKVAPEQGGPPWLTSQPPVACVVLRHLCRKHQCFRTCSGRGDQGSPTNEE